ncbi:hypothetical protein GGP41_005629 [Bipolaris sorokiniana]|uniref:Uncharacterized protein n=1 Tax=Cochliobolus sativus TaxID=45130 RepID=A0A8H5ZI53_COCSA|nr:hypothetical protein GGP41_005629 [Bipolaris sorokiniana]
MQNSMHCMANLGRHSPSFFHEEAAQFWRLLLVLFYSWLQNLWRRRVEPGFAIPEHALVPQELLLQHCAQDLHCTGPASFPSMGLSICVMPDHVAVAIRDIFVPG